MVGMDLCFFEPHRHVEGRVGWGAHRGLLDRLEQLAWDTARGAMDPRASHFTTPMLRAASGVFDVGERLAVEPTLAHVRHLILDTRFVFGRTNPTRVDQD